MQRYYKLVATMPDSMSDFFNRLRIFISVAYMSEIYSTATKTINERKIVLVMNSRA